MKQNDLLKYAAIGVGIYVIYQYFQNNPAAPAGSAATPQEEAQAAATTLSANLASVLGT